VTYRSITALGPADPWPRIDAAASNRGIRIRGWTTAPATESPAALRQPIDVPIIETLHRLRQRFVSIAQNDQGDLLVVDTRAREESGCVRDFAGGDADQSMMMWSSIDALIDEVASAVQRSEPCFGWMPVVNDGALDWELS
jgi:hypothetical protein